jgi:hypothetical protein
VSSTQSVTSTRAADAETTCGLTPIVPLMTMPCLAALYSPLVSVRSAAPDA